MSPSLSSLSHVIPTQHTVCALCSGPLALQCLDVGVAVGHVLLVLALGRRLLLASLLQVALQILIRSKTRRVETHISSSVCTMLRILSSELKYRFYHVEHGDNAAAFALFVQAHSTLVAGFLSVCLSVCLTDLWRAHLPSCPCRALSTALVGGRWPRHAPADWGWPCGRHTTANTQTNDERK